MSELKSYTADEVAQHNTRDDLWIIYEGKVYDASGYLDEHPGGEEVIIDCAGGDATGPFDDIGHSEDAREALNALLIGNLEGGLPTKASSSSSSSTMTADSNQLLLVISGLVVVGAVAYYFSF